MNTVIKSKYTFNIVTITKEKDENTVIEFLMKFFFRDEPLNATMDLTKDQDIIKDLRNYTMKILNEGES